ncbi:hypothetical protein [Sphingobium baderi]|uniref:Uncharacterized protein n=1 Tax=Sphingobium baderi TaxID=1332080 RepID=A0A0S3F1X1_9SPHN|nr:hypothetical protein [Sphingobium baderi]ALR21687.1 hypothetical protein ATN00_16660 [Sphingobium baderi]HJT39425.1 hypothetical protein [Sphingobium sp.]
MAKTFEQFHFSLIERDQPDLLEAKMSREDWLRAKFGVRFDFQHQGKPFSWVPQNWAGDYVVGIIERQKFHVVRTPPNDGAAEIEGSFWTGSMVVIDPRNIPGGQGVAVEANSNVGQPSAILSSLVGHMNAILPHQYAIQFKALFEGGSFWRFAERHGGQLEYVRFKFTVPNMIFGAGGGVKQGLRRIGSDTNAQEIEVKIESAEGIDANSEAVKEGVAYGEEGNASVTAKSLNGDRWSSTKQKMTAKVQSVLDLPKAKVEEVQEWLKQALNREQDSSDSGFDNPDDWHRDN